MPFKVLIALLISGALVHPTAFGATFVVPRDPVLVRRAEAIVIGTALGSSARLNAAGGIETVTRFAVEESIKGELAGQIIDIVEPGGVLDARATVIPGVPQFQEGTRMLLLLTGTGHHQWSVTEIALGKFSFERARNGELLLVRDASEINGWDDTRKPHVERPRSAERFLRFVRDVVAGEPAAADYFFDDEPAFTLSAQQDVSPAVAPYTITSYTMTISGSSGSRWNVFPGSVPWFRGTTAEPGAPNGGATAIQTAIASWNDDCGSNVNYVYAGIDDGTNTRGLSGSDGANTVLFERNLSAYGVAPFTCSGSTYSGVLGLGGITSASGSNSVGGETFFTTLEGDVEMNQGIANCTVLFNNGEFNSAMAHELGHTLGFRHSDQTRDSAGSCSSDPSLECSSLAIMRSSISYGLNAALQTWDRHAVQAVYPGNVCAPNGCTAPAITRQPASTTVFTGQTVTLTVAASGSTPLAYQWYAGSSGNTASPVSGGTNASLAVAPQTTTSYWVRVSNSCGAANSATATVTVVANTPSGATKLYPLTPCRLVDTRNANGPYGGPALTAGAVRNFVVAGRCGIPSGAVALSLNLAVINPSSNGYMTLYPGPAGSSLPLAATINYRSGRVLANNALVRVGSDSLNAYNSGPGSTHFVIDINGYFK